MLQGKFFTIYLLRLVIAVWAVQLPMQLIQHQPNQILVVDFTANDTCCPTEQKSACGATSSSSQSPLECATDPCHNRSAACPSARSCAPCFQLNDQPMFAAVTVTIENRTSLVDVLAGCNETTNTFNFKPPVPPPKNC